MGSVRTVRKRDGREVAFDSTKIADAIFKASCAAGGPDRETADELADVVTHFINKEYTDRTPGIEDIQDLVEKVLMETGFIHTARAYIVYREERRQIRDELKVFRTRSPALSDRPVDVVVDAGSAELTDTWSKGRIVEALIKEAGLSYEVSTNVANAVENKVFASGMKRISTTLIRELVDNELFERDYSAKLSRQTMVGLPKYDLSILLAAKSDEKREVACNNPDAVAMGIAENALKQYALSDLFPTEVADAHLNAELHLVDLGHTTRYYSAVHSIDYIKKYGLALNNLDSVSGAPAHPRTLTAHLITFLASMQAYFSGPQSVPFVNVMYAPMLEGLSGKQMYQEAQSLLFCGSQIAFARGGRTLPLYFGVHSAVPDFLRDVEAMGPSGKSTGKPYAYYEDTAAVFARILLEVWQKGDAAGQPFRYPVCYLHVEKENDRENLLYLTREFGDAPWRPEVLVDEKGGYRATPSMQFEWEAGNARMATHPESIRCAAAHAVVINLAHAAFRAGKGNTRGMLQEIGKTVSIACQAHDAKRRFLASLSATAGRPLHELGRLGADGVPYANPDESLYLVGSVGLDEALAYLYGQQATPTEAARLVQCVEEKLKKAAQKLGLRVAIDPSPPVEAARRLALTDLKFYPQASEVIENGVSAGGPIYS